jgi:hypothetical protein
MFFTRTHTYRFSVTKDDLKNRLIGRHVKIHNLDFEVLDRDQKLTIIPHAEQITDIKTLPITSVQIDDDGGKSKVTVQSKMRQLDLGGPYLLTIFCLFMFIAAIILSQVGGEPIITYTLLGLSVGIFTIFWIRLEMGYFDYVRKIHAYIKSKANPGGATETGMPPMASA